LDLLLDESESANQISGLHLLIRLPLVGPHLQRVLLFQLPAKLRLQVLAIT
jgi:hypothetical protein